MAGDISKARAAKAAKAAGTSVPVRAPPAAARLTGNSTALLVLILCGAAVLWCAFRALTAKLVPVLAGLEPWTGGPGWRSRSGQYIDAQAAESLRAVGATLKGCTPAPMTLDIARQGGGLYPPHVSHQTGRDVDVRMKDLTATCRKALQAAFAGAGWTTWYDGPDAAAPQEGGKHLTHLHARFKQ